MSKSKLLAGLLLLALPACALGESLISDEMIQAETANYTHTATAKTAAYVQEASAQAGEYYPVTCVLRFEGGEARFGEYLVGHKETVKKGDVLAAFDLKADEVALAALRQELARTRQAGKIHAETTQKSLSRQRETMEEEDDPLKKEIMALNIQREEILLEQYESEQARRVAELEKEISDMEAASRQTTLVAPFDGVVVSLTHKTQGARMTQGEALITLCSTERMLLRIDNSQGRFRYGMAVRVAAGPAQSRTMLEGRIVAADQLVNEHYRTGYAYVEITGGEYLSYGVAPTVEAETIRVENVLVLPTRALTLENGKHYVHRLVQGRVEKRSVHVAMQGVTTAWILQGIEDGETLMID